MEFVQLVVVIPLKAVKLVVKQVKVMLPIGSVFSVGSPYIFNFCKDCGEVAAIKVRKPQKFTLPLFYGCRACKRVGFLKLH